MQYKIKQEQQQQKFRVMKNFIIVVNCKAVADCQTLKTAIKKANKYAEKYEFVRIWGADGFVFDKDGNLVEE